MPIIRIPLAAPIQVFLGADWRFYGYQDINSGTPNSSLFSFLAFPWVTVIGMNQLPPFLFAVAFAVSPVFSQTQEAQSSAGNREALSAASSKKSAANAAKALRRIEGSRLHTTRNTSYQFVVEEIAATSDAQEFTGTLVFYGNAGTSRQPLKGRLPMTDLGMPL